jgi:Mor family transcriptional regulator
MNHGITVSVDLLPPLLQDFERIVGLQATMALVRVYGGLRVYFPTAERAAPDHPYASLVGVEAFLKLCEEYGGQQHFQLPKAERALLAVRNAHIAADYGADKTARDIAGEHGLTEGQVVRIVAAMGVKAPPERRQPSLF